jgi:rhodanese-related sulfurtransferase
MSAMPIGFYQFDNLVQGHIPFALFTLEFPFEKIYAGEDLKHLLRQVIALSHVSQEEILSIIENRGYKKDQPIVVLDEKGIASKEIAFALEEMGYMNTFFVLDGFKSLLPENR